MSSKVWSIVGPHKPVGQRIGGSKNPHLQVQLKWAGCRKGNDIAHDCFFSNNSVWGWIYGVVYGECNEQIASS